MMIDQLKTNNIVVTMAGRGSRFTNAGYKVPKYEILAKGKSLFEWSMLSLSNIITIESRIIFVCLAENNSRGFIEQHARLLEIHNLQIIELEEITDGQATSAYLSRHMWKPDSPLLIYNIDTFVQPEFLRYENIKPGSDGWIPCFHAYGDHWSFVKLGKDGWASEVAEKSRISEYASIGLYWFSSAQDYIDSYENFYSGSHVLVAGERYIAPLYRELIAKGKHISISVVPDRNVNVLGTPAELAKFIS